MFWNRFYSLCIQKGIKPNPLGSKIGISSGVITKWKNGAIPNGDTLIKIADYLDCSVDYLLGRTDTPGKTAASVDASSPNQEKLADLYNVLGGFDDDQLQLMLDYAKFLNKSGK